MPQQPRSVGLVSLAADARRWAPRNYTSIEGSVMPLSIKSSDYFVFKIEKHLINKLLFSISEAGVNQLAFKSKLIDSNNTEFTIFPNNNKFLLTGSSEAGITPKGPFPAIIIKSNTDEPGELANIFSRLSKEGIDVIEASGIANIDGHYGVVLYLNETDRDRAIEILNIE